MKEATEKRRAFRECHRCVLYKRQSLPEQYLLSDQATYHKTAKVLKKFQDKRIRVRFIPPRKTSLLQSADVSWMSPLKKAFHKRMDRMDDQWNKIIHQVGQFKIGKC